MTAPLSRRAVLTASASVLGIGLAGCNQSATSGTPEPSTPEDTPEPEPSPSQTRPSTEPETEAATSTPTPEFEIPTPEGECEPVDLPAAEYPSLPDTLTESTAETFARRFEEQYAWGLVGTRDDLSFSGFDGASILLTKSKNDGIFVHVWVSVDVTGEDDETVSVAGSYPSSGWYYVTAAFAVRARAYNDSPTKAFEQMPTRGWETVACRDG